MAAHNKEKLDRGRRETVDGYASACAHTHSPLLRVLPGDGVSGGGIRSGGKD